MRRSAILLIATILFTWIYSCNRSIDSEIPVKTGQFFLHLHTTIDGIEVPGYDSIVKSSKGRKISLSMAQFYISKIKLQKLDGTFYSLPDSVLLRTFETELYLGLKVPTGNYKSVQFTVGLDSLENSREAGFNDSVYNRPEMWFNPAGPQPWGYVFLNFQGKIDTSLNMNSPDNQLAPFIYKIGKVANASLVTLPVRYFTVSASPATYVHLNVNFMNLFEGIDIQNGANLNILHVPDNDGNLAKTIVNKIPSMFSYEF